VNNLLKFIRLFDFREDNLQSIKQAKIASALRGIDHLTFLNMI
jgi:hypothetical protein